MKRRGSGILLHITSLPSPYGIGDFGPSAYQFIDFLAQAGQSFWQILPLNPTSPGLGNSPYSSYSAFAGNPLLISPERLVEKGLISKPEHYPASEHERVDYEAVAAYKGRMLRTAYETYKQSRERDHEFERFRKENSYWLDDYALFSALKEHFNGAMWGGWPRELRDRSETALREWREKLADRISMEHFFQYLVYKQWSSVKSYCNSKSIQVIGDMPIYVSYDSSDVWANPHLFKLDDEKRPTFVAGVPPDYFSATGQLWGNPVYKWDVLKETHYAWWIRRVEHNLKLFDTVRLDHFRGFVAYWEVPAGQETAINGRWVEAPARDFFNALFRKRPYPSIIAEDLGYITPDVREVINAFEFPTMKLLLFAFGGDLATSPYAPHNYVKNCVVYTGTHDNNTIRGWFRKETGPDDKRKLFEYLGRQVGEETIHWELIRLAMMSVADTAILPMQDILGLGEEARMNLPATTKGNWGWRLRPDQLNPALVTPLLQMTRIYGRV